MEDSFFFALLRISVAQILKASGFDKCKPLVLDIVTSLYVKQLEMLILKSTQFSVARTNSVNDVCAQDVAEALLALRTLKPTINSDPEDTKNTKSLKAFKEWTEFSDSYAVSKRLSAVPKNFIANLIEKRKIDTSSETDQERKKRRLRERQEYFNQLKQGEEPVNSGKKGDIGDDFDDEELASSNQLSWLAYLAEKDVKLGQNLKFVNTCIQDELIPVHKLQKFHPTPPDGESSFSQFKSQIYNSGRNDHVLLQVEEENPEEADVQVAPSQELKNMLPYNVTYDECLVSDDLQQYVQYATAHEDEIEKRLMEIYNYKGDREGLELEEANGLAAEEEKEGTDQKEENDETEETSQNDEKEENDVGEEKNQSDDENQRVEVNEKDEKDPKDEKDQEDEKDEKDEKDPQDPQEEKNETNEEDVKVTESHDVEVETAANGDGEDTEADKNDNEPREKVQESEMSAPNEEHKPTTSLEDDHVPSDDAKADAGEEAISGEGESAPAVGQAP